jgi:hypothetical protein
MNAKYSFWNSAVSNPSGENFLELFHVNDFEISAPENPTHYCPAGNGDVLDIVVHQNIRLSHVILSDILDSDHLPIVFHVMEHVTTKRLSEPLENSQIGNGFRTLPLT